MSLRLMLVADDPLSASAVRRAVRATCAFQMPDGYADGRGPCGQIAVVQRPDVVVVDQMRSLDATIARISEVRAALPDVKIVLLPARMDPMWLSHAAAAGADAAIAKTLRLAGIGALIREVAVGNVFHAFDAGPPPPRPAASGFPALTEREFEVLRLVAAGTPNGRIAAQLSLAEQTVKFHLSKIYRKLGLTNRTEASHYAHVHGLLEPQPRHTLDIESAA